MIDAERTAKSSIRVPMAGNRCTAVDFAFRLPAVLISSRTRRIAGVSFSAGVGELLTGLAVDLCGDIHVTELSFSLESRHAGSRVLIVTADQGRVLLPRRATTA
jgi:hypothetical protein